MSRRGFSLVELLIAITIMLIAVALAGALIMAGVNLTRRSDQQIQRSDDARFALNEIATALNQAGSGAPGGIYLNFPTGTPTLYNAVYGMDGSTANGGNLGTAIDASTSIWNTDDLWIVSADRNMLGAGCVPGTAGQAGAATTLVTTGTGILKVRCTGDFAATDTLLASDMTTAALLSPPLTLTAAAAGPPFVPGTIDYSESGVSAYSNDPSKGGFQQGDMIYKASVVHYFVADITALGGLGLYRSQGALTGTAPSGTYPNGPYDRAGRPFVDLDGTAVLVQRNVDDLQVAFALDSTGSGDPATFTWANGLAPAYNGSLRAVRVGVSVRSPTVLLDSNNHTVLSSTTQRKVLENHFVGPTDKAVPTADGYSRALYSRTVVLPNLAPGSL